VVYSTPARGFTAAVSVFGGTPPPKPLICKLIRARIDDGIARSWAHHLGDGFSFVLAKFIFAPSDII